MERNLKSLFSLQELYLDYNRISFISNHAFNGLRYLRKVNLTNNRLVRFPEGLLMSVFTLRDMDLSRNRLETLKFNSTDQFFKNLNENGSLILKGEFF